MTANWSLILNIALLVSVVCVLVYTLRKKHETILPMDSKKPALSVPFASTEDIIAVRKIELEDAAKPQASVDHKVTQDTNALMIFLLAKSNKNLAGYEMLQAILSSGMRFGEKQLFHLYEVINGHETILFSLAAATKEGTFDLQNIGAFNAKGLCLFMYKSKKLLEDEVRLNKMIDVANQLAEGLNIILLDDMQKPFTQQTADKYYARLKTDLSVEA
ncbi:MAG: hypothetical protein A3F18_05770 [Legionellales bacterium RIFCSPHIGHO2_12_FULL_37_14]|nr:MAG: hypothetical protein A3F18_05770 [Legionellales bacterium RIFCSPHIGHO2_12_FULL_37_14]